VFQHDPNKEKVSSYEFTKVSKITEADAGIVVKSGTANEDKYYTFEEVQEELMITEEAKKYSEEFNLKSNQCTDFALDLLNVIGVGTSENFGKMEVNNFLTGKTEHYANPTSLYHDLKDAGFDIIIKGDENLFSKQRAKQYIEKRYEKAVRNEIRTRSSGN
jgi:hypothetical protein